MMNKVSLSSVSCVFPITETHYFYPLACKICKKKKKIVLDLQITSLFLPPLAFFLFLFFNLFLAVLGFCYCAWAFSS